MMFENEINAEGRPICTQCFTAVKANDELPEDSMERGAACFTSTGGIAIVHKSCAVAAGIPVR